MSTTSTNYTGHRIRRGGRSGDLLTSSREHFTTGGSRTSQPQKWSSDKVIDELSSFIAEFSYLTDTSNKPPTTEQDNPTTSQNAYQVFAVGKEDTDTPFDNPAQRGRKFVDWEDRSRNVVCNTETECTDSCNVPVKRGRIIRQGRVERHPKVRVGKSRPRRNDGFRFQRPRSKSRARSRSRSRSKSTRKVKRRFSNFRASKSRGRRRARSCQSEGPLRRMRRRTVSSKSTVKHIPLHYRPLRRKSSRREVIIKKQKPITVVKNIVPVEEPKLVTLFPNRCERSIIRDPELPCKCSECTKKYRSLIRLGSNTCRDSFRRPRSPVCSPCSPRLMGCPVLPRGCGPCAPNWYCKPGAVACIHPCTNQCYTDGCRTPFRANCFKSVNFKFGSTGQCLNANITEYFHSILDAAYCC